MPSDEITVHYRCNPEGEYLDSVIKAHTDFILATIKAPLVLLPAPKSASVIIEEKTQVCLSRPDQCQLSEPALIFWIPLRMQKVTRALIVTIVRFCDFAAEGLGLGVDLNKRK